MRRTTSALTTAVLGAVLTASTISAQQLPAPDNAPRAQSPATDSTAAPASGPAAVNSPLYGTTPSRSARFLLRNGLDYLGYQQYERSLKFLREAEARQKELNESERLALKQGIENAQRGMRKASDAEPPYALSDQARSSNGFTPAKPATRIAANAGLTRRQTRTIKANPPPSLLGPDGDEQGEPIRLASGETPISDPSTGPPLKDRMVHSSETDPSMNTPETPHIPSVSQLPDLTEADGSERQVVAEVRSAASLQSSAAPMPAVAGAIARPVRETSLQSPAASLPAAAGGIAPRVREASLQSSAAPLPAAAGGVAPPVRESSQAPELSPTPPASSPSSSSVAAASGALPAAMPAPALGGPGGPAPAPKPTRNAAVIDLETVPSSTTAEVPPPPAEPGVAVRKAIEPAMPASTTGASILNAPSAKPAKAGDLVPASTDAGDVLPPLPADLSHPVATLPISDVSANLPVLPASVQQASPGEDALPPLPAEPGRAAPDGPAPVVTPSPITAAPVPVPSPAPSSVAGDQPAQPAAPGTAHTEQESPALVPAGVEERSAPAAADPESRTVDAGSAPTLPPAASAAAGAAGESPAVPTNAELPQLPAEETTSPAATPPGQPFPATNPNLAPPPTASAAAGVETTPDVSSLPPAIANRPVAGGSDLFIPDRVTPPSTLRPELKREVEKIARNQEDELRRQVQNPTQPAPPGRDTMASDLRTQTQMDISRAPSPAEARPIKAIPVPEDWVPLPPRDWSPQRKYWAAAATCHLPLYFQDPVLERYGHSVEQFVGPIGRWLTYPLDDPTQSTQRNQMLQPFFSAGLMGLQIVAWPYNLLMDPPWEAQYDLGYYRPGDNIPTDTYWLPLHGYGPPLHGSNY